MDIRVPDHVREALSALEAAGFESYAVGGCVRDALLGREPHDWDLTTAALPEEVERVFAGQRVLETGMKHGTVTLLTPWGPLEITTFRSDGLYSDSRRPDSVTFIRDVHADLLRRDFTVNAMAYSPLRGLRDDFGGREDLAAGVLRCVGRAEDRFAEDALRILRALRFAARYGFTVEPETDAAARKLRRTLERISPERIFSELKGILCAPGAGRVMLRYPEIFFTVLPELEGMLGFDQCMPENHQWDVWGHTAHAVDGVEQDPVLRLTMLFHDSGKPDTFTRDETGHGHFYGHPERSAEIADATLRRLRCDNFTRETVVTLVTYHDFRGEGSRRAIRRLLSRIGEENMLRLHAVRLADAGAHTPAARDRMLARDREDMAALSDLTAEPTCLSVKDLAIGGSDLLELGLRPGPAVGEALRRLLEDVLDEKLPNEREALLSRAAAIKEELAMKESVTVTWLGHACFKLEYKGWSLIIDPYADGSVDGLGPVRESAGAVYCSHAHGDHGARENVTLTGQTPPADYAAETAECPHDDEGGAKRGMNTIHIFTFGDKKVVHMGDVGCPVGEEILSKIRNADLMLLPVGGFFTVDAAQARDIAAAAKAKAVVPMHYKGEGFGFGVLSTLDEFTALFPAEEIHRLEGPSFILTDDTAGVVVPTPKLLA